MNSNAGWLFYKQYYKEIDFLLPKDGNEDAFQRANQKLTKINLPDQFRDPLAEALAGLQHFDASTTYPGLLIGSGYQHETNRLGELKLGFFFDHTLGLPVIPGSSVKGTLRSAFKTHDLITTLLKKPAWKPEQVEALEEDMFEAKNRPMRFHDTFFDALPISQEGKEHGILAEDFLTPHAPTDEKYGAFQNPVPIGFLKVRAGVQFRFRFRFNDNASLGVSKEDKLSLCEQLILHLGMGSKTAIGYGYFVNNKWAPKPEPKTLVPERNEGPEEGNRPDPPSPPTTLPNYDFASLRRFARQGGYIIGKIIDNQGKKISFEYSLEGDIQTANIPYGNSQVIEVGRFAKMAVIDPGSPEKKQAPRFNFRGYKN